MSEVLCCRCGDEFESTFDATLCPACDEAEEEQIDADRDDDAELLESLKEE